MEVAGLKTDRIKIGNESAQFAVVFRMLAGVRVLFGLPVDFGGAGDVLFVGESSVAVADSCFRGEGASAGYCSLVCSGDVVVIVAPLIASWSVTCVSRN